MSAPAQPPPPTACPRFFDPETAVLMSRIALPTGDSAGEYPGIALCAPLRLLVISNAVKGFLLLFAVGADGGLTPTGAIGGPGTPAGPLLHLTLFDRLAFTATPGGEPTLLATQWSRGSVVEVDVVGRAPLPPGGLQGPLRGRRVPRPHRRVRTAQLQP